MVLGQPVRLAELRRTVRAAVAQQSRLFTASRAPPPQQLLLRLARRALCLARGLDFGLGIVWVVVGVACWGEFGREECVLEVLFFSECGEGYL